MGENEERGGEVKTLPQGHTASEWEVLIQSL